MAVLQESPIGFVRKGKTIISAGELVHYHNYNRP